MWHWTKYWFFGGRTVIFLPVPKIKKKNEAIINLVITNIGE